MNVREILTHVARLSIGLDDPTPDDLTVYLGYLNLASIDLFRKTALINPRVTLSCQTGPTVDGGTLTLPETAHAVPYVVNVDNKLLLPQTSFDDLIVQDPTLSDATSPPGWWYLSFDARTQKSQIAVYPKKEGVTLSVYYIAEPTPLKLDDQAAAILIPVAFHNVLIDGTAYYLYQSETGVKDNLKMQMAANRWAAQQQALVNFFRAAAGMGNTSSTYSGDL